MISKKFSKEFQNELLDLFKMSFENNTDTIKLTFKYPHVNMMVEMTFKAEIGDDDCRS